MLRAGWLAVSTLLMVSLVSGQQVQTLRTRVDVVIVPTSVRDSDGKLVAGLGEEDFVILEDGVSQKISNFSADPQPLSAAIIIDTGMGGISMRRLVPLFVSITGGFSIFDEMASFRYDHLVHQLSDFTTDPEKIEKSFEVVKTIAEKQPAQVAAGTSAPTAPKFLQLLLDTLRNGANQNGGVSRDPMKSPPPPTIEQKKGPGSVPTSRVLYDAVYEAAKALELRPKDHRKIIFIISDGQIAGTMTHNLDDTTNLLVKDEIQLYGVTTDFAAFEGRFGALSNMAKASGGDVYRGLSTDAMETAFARITEQARNQYVLGYHSTNVTEIQLPTFRNIEVKVRNSDWKVTHRKGYFQIP